MHSVQSVTTQYIIVPHRDDYSNNTYITRMTTFIITKFKNSDYKTNFNKYKVAANITEYHIIIKIFLQLHLGCLWTDLKKNSFTFL